MSFEPRESVVTLMDRLRRTRRPRLLLRTARFGLAEYRRERDLRAMLRLPAAPPPGPATVALLLDLEAAEEARRSRPTAEPGEAWRAARHVELLVALIAETQLMAAAVAPAAGDAPPLDHGLRIAV